LLQDGGAGLRIGLPRGVRAARFFSLQIAQAQREIAHAEKNIFVWLSQTARSTAVPCVSTFAERTITFIP
jgi:hypothetical protein